MFPSDSSTADESQPYRGNPEDADQHRSSFHFRGGEKKLFLLVQMRRSFEADALTDGQYILPRKDVAWEKEGWLSLWGPVDADTTHGSLGTGIVVPRDVSVETYEDSVHHFFIGRSSHPSRFTYYAGAGWTRSGDFMDEASWQTYLSQYTCSLRYPLSVSVRPTH